MADREEGREKTNSASGLSGIFKGLANLVEAVGKMEREGLVEINKNGRFNSGRNIKGVYGYTVRMGLNGTPLMERFGHSLDDEKLPEEDVREPIVDIIPEEDHFLVIAEMPGVDEADINIVINDENVLITADAAAKSGRKYRKEITIKGLKGTAQFCKSYRNGVLELRVNKNRD
ncbi:MAG: Hsp20/alpha crystallin family protein [Bacillota bacterium]